MRPSDTSASAAGTPSGAIGLANIVVHAGDVDASITFYCGLLGLQLRFDTGWKSSPDMLGVTSTPPGTMMRLARLLIPGSDEGITVSSFQGFDPLGAQLFERPGTVHFGLVVGDLQACLTKLAQHGVVPFGEPTELGPPHARSRLAFIRDPDGIVVELVQHGVGEPTHQTASNEVDS